MIPPTCTGKAFSVQIDGPVSGVTYTLTQPGNNNPPVSILANGNPVIFTGLVFDDGFSVRPDLLNLQRHQQRCWLLQTRSMTE